MFEREILDHAAFLRDEEEAARLEYELQEAAIQEYDEEMERDLNDDACWLPPEECPAGWDKV